MDKKYILEFNIENNSDSTISLEHTYDIRYLRAKQTVLLVHSQILDVTYTHIVASHTFVLEIVL